MPGVRVLKVIVLFPTTAAVVFEVQPPVEMVPASVDEKVKSGVESWVVDGTGMTSANTGAVLSTIVFSDSSTLSRIESLLRLEMLPLASLNQTYIVLE